MVKTLMQVGREGTALKINRPYMKSQLMSDSILSDEKVKTVLLRQDCPHSSLLFNIVLEVLATSIWQQKEMKEIQIGKEEVKLSLFVGDMILYIENPKDTSKKPKTTNKQKQNNKLLELFNEFHKGTE